MPIGPQDERFAPGQDIEPKTRCRWLPLRDAAQHFAAFGGATQSAAHIKPFHWYSACRLVVEGGFRPEEVKPRPPFEIDRVRGCWMLRFVPAEGGWSEATVFGGLKTKNVDVVASKPGIGPVLAISHKGATGAFRNLTNRMEETIGECTNLHISYPALVMGYFAALRANRNPEKPNDLAIEGTHVVDSITRFHHALVELTGRTGIRDDPSRYEAIALLLLETTPGHVGDRVTEYLGDGSPLAPDRFFTDLYRRYDERYVYGAPAVSSVTERVSWSPDSPALQTAPAALDYSPRIAG